MRNPLHAHDIGIRIKALNKKLDGICTRGGKFNFIKLETCNQKTTRSLVTDRKTDSLLKRSGAVGEKIEEDTRALVNVLTNEAAGDKSNCPMVIATVGLGGIGKTTLAKKVFNDEAIEGKFIKKIWLSITRDFNDVELLSTAMTAAGGDLPGGGGSRDKALLVLALRNAIKDKKFFLVLDDVWDVSEWDKLLMTPFSYGGFGNRVLITTRLDTVGRSMKAVHYHRVDKLGPEDAWSLLKKQVLTTEKDGPEVDMLKDIGLQIIAKCDCLPLAVKVMGGLLCKEKTRNDWEDVLNNDIWLPENIHEMKFLQHINLEDCEGFVKLPDSIVKLQALRYLDFDRTHLTSIPRCFHAPTNLRVLCGFPAYTDGDWCSLEELEPLSQLKVLGLQGLENVSTTSFVAKARIGAKTHLTKLDLSWGSRVGDDGLVTEVSEEEAGRAEEVLQEIRPLPCLENIGICGYFGRHLPGWMMSTAMMPLMSLKVLVMEDLALLHRTP